MGLTTDLQDCMDTSDWFQQGSSSGAELEVGMDHSSASSGDMITTSTRSMLERRLRPQHDQALNCPRCDSTHTKFCYYNNYSLSQPRYFCKTCRRYWTKGGSLRNIPVGGGCRKNKRPSSSSSSSSSPTTLGSVKKSAAAAAAASTDLHLSTFPHEVLQLPYLCNSTNGGFNFMETKFDAILGGDPHDPMRTHSTDFMATTDLGINGFTFASTSNNNIPHHSTLCTPYGISLSGNNLYSSSSTTTGNIVDSNCQRFVVPFDEGPSESTTVEMKPNKQLLSIDWQDPQQGCSEIIGKDYPFGYFSSLGSWMGSNGVMSAAGFGSSATNPLV